MSKLKIELYNVKNLLIGRVVEQDETLRSQTGSIIAKKKWQIQSCHSPSLDVDNCILFVRGSKKELDNNWFSGEFETEQEALVTAQMLKEMIEELNEEEKLQEIKLNKII